MYGLLVFYTMRAFQTKTQWHYKHTIVLTILIELN